MKILYSILYIFIFLLFTNNILYASDKQNLSNNPYWLKLLYYENNTSIINDDSFFLSENGKVNPKEELDQTLKSFQKDNSLICKYPARYKWLNSKLQLDIKKQNCPKLENFLKPDFSKFSIVFTSPRYDSPGSVFGHTFLKVYSKTIPYAINYAAKVPENENSFLYAYRGMTGKYQSGYKILPYSRKDYEYRSEESRDLIEFDLELSDDEKENILLYMFEIKDTRQDYYFLSRNCSSELLKLLDLAKYDSNFSKSLSGTTIPIDIIYILKENSMINGITKYISKMKLFYTYLDSLSTIEKQYVLDMINDKLSIRAFDRIEDIDMKTKKVIIATTLKYFEIFSLRSEVNQKLITKTIRLAKLKIKYNISEEKQTEQKLSQNPISNRTHKFYFGKKQIKNQFVQNTLGYRHMYTSKYDMQNDDISFGSIELLDISLRQIDDTIELDNLTLINLEAIPPTNKFFKDTSVNITSGIQRIYPLDDKLYSYFDYLLGYNFAFSSNFYFKINGGMGVYYHNDDIYKQTVSSSLLYNYKNKLVSELTLKAEKYNSIDDGKSIVFDNHIKLNKYSNISLSLSTHNFKKKYTQSFLNYIIFF